MIPSKDDSLNNLSYCTVISKVTQFKNGIFAVFCGINTKKMTKIYLKLWLKAYFNIFKIG